MSVLALSAVLAPMNGTVAAAPVTTTTSATSPTATSTSGTGTNSSACLYKQSPPPAEDGAEQPAPGVAAPSPLPVPTDPIGGSQLGGCGWVLPSDSTAKLPPSEVNAASWVLADLDTGQILAAKDPHGRQRPAALVKVLLAMVALTELKPSTPVLAVAEDVDSARNTAKIGIAPGAKYTVDQLVRAMLMRPGNDVPHALARAVGGPTGGVQKALQKMNDLAAKMGALDTRIITPTGLDGPGMSTSAYDLALIYRHAIQLPAFAEAQAAKSVTLGGTVIRNSDPLMTSFPGAIAGITSNTTNAHWTNLSAATRNGRRLVTVLLRMDQEQNASYRQAAKLLDYGFDLSGAAVHPVGNLVDNAPPQSLGPTKPSTTGTEAVGSTHNDAAGSGPMFDAFGNVGMPLTVVAGVVVLVALAMYLRKRRIRAARAKMSASIPH
ncbi:MAG: D-alanyl-D-alanine carboxypeptidase [Kutzneria sp.]|nr:D-alanyl-D-alanine carboxypeptidase [Kutzneria sp.]